MALKPKAIFIIDSREQLPFQFSNVRRRDLSFGGTRREALDAGDYGIELEGELLPIRLERKSISDYFGICSNRFSQRDRFERELERLRWLTAYLIIEADAETIRKGYERSQVSGEAALGSAVCWSVKYGICPIFAGTRRTAQRVCQQILEEFAAHFKE